MTIGSLLSKAGRQALDLFFPPRCAVCGCSESFICRACRTSLPRTKRPRCPICWQAGTEVVCWRCREWKPAFEGVRSPYVFEAGVEDLVHALKYRQQRILAGPMADLLFDFLSDHPLPADVVVPVPLFPRKERTRGYNQSALLARRLARRTGLEFDEGTLMRVRNTASQVETRSAEERRSNMRDAFRCGNDSLAGKRVLLVDDVSTTGATLDACARALREAGVKSVWGLTFAREDPPSLRLRNAILATDVAQGEP
jgi:ComF family protein